MPANRISEVVQHLRHALLRDGDGQTDGQLLGHFIEHRDEAAFTVLMQRHGPMVWGVCRRILGSQHDAEDAFQATFLVLVRKAASVRPREMVANFLYGVAQQTARKARAIAARRRSRERQVKEMPEPAMTEQAPWDDLQPLLDQELSHLPDRYRAVLVLCDLEGKTRQEAARQLGCPEGTVASRLATARTMLAKRLARHGLGVSGGMLAALLSQKAVAGSVPASVIASTLKAAALVAAGSAAAAVSAPVAVLVKGVMKSMLLCKLKAVAAGLLVIAILGAGAARLIHRTQAAGPAEGSQKGAQPKRARKPDANLGTRFQVRFVGPAGAMVQLFETKKPPRQMPCRLTFDRPGTYRLKLSDIPDHPGLVLYPTIELFAPTAKTAEYVAHDAIPVAITREDLELAVADKLATRVIALADEPGASPMSERGDAETIETAKKKGALLLVLRLGSIDLEP